MEPKDKAKSLVENFKLWTLDFGKNIDYAAKQCALIAVGELVIEAYDSINEGYWIEVAKEIEKL